MHYIPPPGEWAETAAEDFSAAAAYATAHETHWPPSLFYEDGTFAIAADMGEPAPWNEVVGPVVPRGGPSGIVLRGGRIAAHWGDIGRPEMTFSVAKSCLALVAGFALAENRIAGLDDPVAEAAPDPGFDTAQNRAVTWRHLLDQTSEWEGEVWGKPDRIDRNRVVGLKARDAPPKGGHRDLRRPGTYWEYNDVRVNRLAMSLTQVFRGSLEDEFRLRIMDPIGASAHWRWHAYRNAWIEIDGRRVPSVPGGGHWGGGIVVSALDLARLGLLVLRGGAWGERRVLPAGWSDEILRPCRIQPGYGLMWWLNPGYCASAAAPQSSFFAMGAGSHVLWIDRGLDLVVVLRWIHKAHIEGVVARIMHAVRPPP